MVPLTQRLKMFNRVVLAYSVHSPDSLLDLHRVPRQVVVDEDMAELKVPPFSARLGAYEYPGTVRVAKVIHGAVLVHGSHLTMKDVDAPAFGSEHFFQET